MAKDKKHCLLDSQIANVVKAARGESDCDKANEFVKKLDEEYETDIQITKPLRAEEAERAKPQRKGRKKKSIGDKIEDGIHRKITNRILAFVDGLI